MKNQNSKQDVQIGKMERDICWIKKSLNAFINNEFVHLRSKVDWLIGVIILGTLISILIRLI